MKTIPLADRPPMPCPDAYCHYLVCGECSGKGLAYRSHVAYNGVCWWGHMNRVEPHTCRCGHHAAEHSNVVNGACLADECACEQLTETYSGTYYEEA